MDMVSAHDVVSLHLTGLVAVWAPPAAAKVDADGIRVSHLAILNDPVMSAKGAQEAFLRRRNGNAVGSLEQMQALDPDEVQKALPGREHLLARHDLEVAAVGIRVIRHAHVNGHAIILNPKTAWGFGQIRI